MRKTILVIFAVLITGVLIVMVDLPGQRSTAPASDSIEDPGENMSSEHDIGAMSPISDERLMVHGRKQTQDQAVEDRNVQSNSSSDSPRIADSVDTTRSNLIAYVESAYPDNPEDPYVAYHRAKELLAWEKYCEQIQRAISNTAADNQGPPPDYLGQLQSGASFCDGIEQFAEHMGDVQVPEHEMPYSVVAKYPELEVMDGESADRFVARELDRALDRGAFLEVSELVFLELEDIAQFPVQLPVPSYINAMESVAVYLLCQRHGGCDGSNAWVLRLCYDVTEYCLRPPRDLYDALDQRLSGAEREVFNEALAYFERLLANVN
ncbi:MAG: hypothetical protein Kow0020_09790 [Wenzhouxiangellaceae bacterium]